MLSSRGSSLLQRPIEAGTADPRQLAHPLDTQAALHRHHFSDLVVDAVSPEPLPFWRRASTYQTLSSSADAHRCWRSSSSVPPPCDGTLPDTCASSPLAASFLAGSVGFYPCFIFGGQSSHTNWPRKSWPRTCTKFTSTTGSNRTITGAF